MVANYVLDHRQVHVLIAVDDDVSKASHIPQRGRQGRRHETGPRKKIKQLAIGLWLSKPVVRHDVGGYVQGSLDRDLEGMFDEALLAQVLSNRRGPGQGSQLLDTRLDQGELLRNELGIRHAGIRR